MKAWLGASGKPLINLTFANNQQQELVIEQQLPLSYRSSGSMVDEPGAPAFVEGMVSDAWDLGTWFKFRTPSAQRKNKKAG